MKKIILLLVFAISTTAFGDIVTIEGRSYSVEILKVKKSKVVFTMDGDRYNVPIKNVETIFFDENGSNYEENTEALLKLIAEENSCVTGTMDAQGRGKTVINVLGGAFFGPFALIVVGLNDFHPSKDYANVAAKGHTDLMDDVQYIQCYRQKAKTKALTEAAGGWAMWILLILASA